jgi:ribosomal protein L21E
VHSYMLGPNGDSNGCISIKDYDRFLKAYNNGEVTRIVVVPSIREGLTASRHSTSPS